jgi:phenylalanyl-tRNA synthetase beta chain
MRVPVEWLTEYADPGLPVGAIEERLTMTGTKVDAVHHHGVGELERFVVGRVLEAQRHPDADRLTICEVDVGDGGPQQIVCGAPNVAAGQIVAVARPGAVMPDGTKLGVAKLRGVESNGMILAEDELGIGTDHAGIMVLDDGLEPGTPLTGVLPIATEVLELEITSNRPDCLAVYGVARELHAATGAPLKAPPWSDDHGIAGPIENAEVRVEAPDLCPRFTARVFEDVKIGPSPPWLKARLMAAGQRPINNVVDITNYVMLLVGSPLHAFDFDRVAGGLLVVRRAQDGEKVTTLDGQTRTLDRDMLVIDDADGPTSLAGVMGGERSEVHEGTTRVLMEVANWHGFTIHRTSQLLGLRSEASSRFEKGLAPEQAMQSQIVATQLMLELTGARLVPGTIDVGGEGPPPAVIRLREQKVADLLGRPIERARQAEILRALEFGVEEAPDGLDVSVPPFRRIDVYREADLVEEVARIDGLEKLPATLPKRRGTAGRLTTAQRLRRRAIDALVGRGMYETIGWTLTDEGLADRLRLDPDDPRRHFVAPENPMSEEHAVLRTTLAGSVLDAARHNAARGMPDLALFECGTVFLESGEQLPHEHRALAGIVTGRLHPQTWGTPEPPRAGFFAANGLLGAALDAVRVSWQVRPATEPFLHPGRAASVVAGGEEVGWVGELHPLVARAWDLDTAAAMFEVDLDRVLTHADPAPQYVDVTSFPALRRDLALSIPADIASEQLLDVVRESGAPLLEKVRIFDLYTGEQAGEGRKSLAMHLDFRAADRTLTDDEVNAVIERIVQSAHDRLGATHRA